MVFFYKSNNDENFKMMEEQKLNYTTKLKQLLTWTETTEVNYLKQIKQAIERLARN